MFGVLQVKSNVQNLQRDLDEIKHQLAADKSSIRVLKAEWAYLNKPERVERIANKYLQMNNISVAQVYSSSQVDNLYLASLGSTPNANPNVTQPVLKPILSSARGYR
jgi:hypothetical protein